MPTSENEGQAESAGHVALVVSAAPLAHHTGRTYDALSAAGWRVTVCPTAAAEDWIDRVPRSALLTGRIRPDAVICCPATFNTINKWAAGINDSLALGVLNDALGLGTPILVVPMVADRLSRHPTWPVAVAFLNAAGVMIMDAASGAQTSRPKPLASGTGDHLAEQFDARHLVAWLQPRGRQGPA